MEPHMIEIYILIVFVIVVNHVGFIFSFSWSQIVNLESLAEDTKKGGETEILQGILIGSWCWNMIQLQEYLPSELFSQLLPDEPVRISCSRSEVKNHGIFQDEISYYHVISVGAPQFPVKG